MARKITWFVFFCVFLVGTILSVYFGVQLIRKNDQIDNMYTKEQYDDNYDKGVDDALKTVEGLPALVESLQKENEEYKTQNTIDKQTISVLEKENTDYQITISDLQAQNAEDKQTISDLQSQNEILQQEKTALETSNAEKTAEIASLESQITANNTRIAELETTVADRDSTIESLNTTIEANNSEISRLTNKVSELETTITENEATIADLQTQIDNLTTDNSSLQTEIDRLQGLVDNYESILYNTSVVNFYINDVATYSISVENGNTIAEVPVPADTNEYRFDGWSSDRETIINVSEKIINAPTSFYAVLTPKYQVDFVCDDVVHTEYIIENESVNVYTAPTKEDHNFVGWTNSTGEIVDLTDVVATEDVTYTAKYEFILDYDAVITALTNKEQDYISSDYREVVELEYLSFIENVLFASYSSADITSARKYLGYFDLTDGGTYTEEITTNAVLLDRIANIEMKQAQAIAYTFSNTEKYDAAALEKFNLAKMSENSLTSSVSYMADYGLTQEGDTYSVYPTVITIGNAGEKVIVEKAPYKTTVASGENSSVTEMCAMSILSMYGYYDSKGIYTTTPVVDTQKAVYTDRLTWVKTDSGTSGDSQPVVSSVFGENDAATVAYVSEQIAANNMTSEDMYNTYGWSVGDTTDITLTNGEVIQMQIIGVNHDVKSDGTGKAGLTLQMVDCLSTLYKMNDTQTNAGGYAASKMKTETLPFIKALLPQEWQDFIKFVDKKSANGGSSNYSETLTLSEDVFLLSEIEIFGTTSYAQDGTNEGSVYEYWNGKPTGDRIKKYDTNADGVVDTVIDCWLRSARSGITIAFCGVHIDGVAYFYAANFSYGVSFAFCV